MMFFVNMRSLMLLTFFICYCLGYKEYLFKNCDQSGFCHRNRHFAREIEKSKVSSAYSIDAESVHIDNSGSFIKGNIIKNIPRKAKQVELPFVISLIGNEMIRFQVDEAGREDIILEESFINPRRYNETSKWAFETDDLNLTHIGERNFILSKKDLKVTYGPNERFEAVLTFETGSLVVRKDSVPQLIMNDRKFLNIEHYRTEEENELHLSPQESSFDMFHDSFKGATLDPLDIGPESVAVDFTFSGYKHVYGIPEHADSLDLRDTTDSAMPYRLFNVDIFEYETDSRMPMYGSIPLMIASKNSSSAGIFWVNSADTFVDIDKKTSTLDVKTHWMSENNILDVVFFVADNPKEINRMYGSLTGYTALHPQFSMGYHQCRWNYNDEKDVLEINSMFDKFAIPYDTIWLDVEYADQKKYFTWQPNKFPHPQDMLAQLDHSGRNLVVLIDPHFKLGYSVSSDLEKMHITIKNSKNKTYTDSCWPGVSLWIDTMNPNSFEYWDMLHKLDDNSFMGSALNIHLWNDMNEPSMFGGIETTSPKYNLHYGNWEHRSIHNVFGLSYHQASYNAMIKRLESTPRQRPFILTRSFFAGSQRTAGMWTGDNMSKWKYLKSSIPSILTMGVSGMPFAGSDVGGFFGNPSKELLTRWYQAGIWYPFFRAHAHLDSRRREPWVPGDPYTSIIRDSILLRYSLLQQLYTALYTSSTTGEPILRPLFYESQENELNYITDDQFFLGDSGIMVKPITDSDIYTSKIIIPDSEVYYDYTDGVYQNKTYDGALEQVVEKEVTLENIPILLKGGHIIARKMRLRRSSKLMKLDPYTLVIAPAKSGESSGFIYVDDGESFAYNKGEYLIANFFANKTAISCTIDGSESFFNQLTHVNISRIIILDSDELETATLYQNEVETSLIVKQMGPRSWSISNPKIRINQGWTIQLNLAPLKTGMNTELVDLKTRIFTFKDSLKKTDVLLFGTSVIFTLISSAYIRRRLNTD